MMGHATFVRMKFGPVLLLSAILLGTLTATAQVQIGFGASGSYNFQTEGWGFGVRAEGYVIKSLSVVIQGQYYPSFNKVHEVGGGLELHYAPYYHPIVRPYILAGGSVTNWFNYTESNYKLAKPLNFIAEVGGGLVFLDKQWRPFAEYRYNPIFLEGSVHVGLMYFPKWRSSNRENCPAYL
jgi:hypothetical protein